MSKKIHDVEPGDLVRRSEEFCRISPNYRGRMFLVLDITAPIGYENYRGDPTKTDEMSIQLLALDGPWACQPQWVSMNLYEVIS